MATDTAMRSPAGHLKGGIIGGAYHSVSANYLQNYLNEYAARYNNSSTATPSGVFGDFLHRLEKGPRLLDGYLLEHAKEFGPGLGIGVVRPDLVTWKAVPSLNGSTDCFGMVSPFYG